MSDKKEFREIEIDGVKLEVDLRNAKKIEHYRIGDRVKILVKKYSSYKPHPGVIVAFDNFKNKPTITVAYLDIEYSGATINFAYIYPSKPDDEAEFELAPYNDDIMVSKGDVLDKLNNEIVKKQAEIEDLERKKSYFLKNFQQYFGDPEKL